MPSDVRQSRPEKSHQENEKLKEKWGQEKNDFGVKWMTAGFAQWSQWLQ